MSITAKSILFTGFAIVLVSAAAAQDPGDLKPTATQNACWGDITSDFAHLQTGIIGQHSRAHDPVFRPEQQPRLGVGNVSKLFGELSEGAQGEHGIVVGGRLGLTCDQF